MILVMAGRSSQSVSDCEGFVVDPCVQTGGTFDASLLLLANFVLGLRFEPRHPAVASLI